MMFYRQYAKELAETLDRLPWAAVQQVVDLLLQTWRSDGQIFVMGNGGSASTASHVACDFGKNTAVPSAPRLRVLSLNDNMALFSAHANDNGYADVFAEQVSTLARRGDVLLAISTSGNSPNVLKGVTAARTLGAKTIGWSGYEGGELARIVDLPIVVPNHRIQQVEDVHLILGHMVTTALRDAMQASTTARMERVAAPALELHGNNHAVHDLSVVGN